MFNLKEKIIDFVPMLAILGIIVLILHLLDVFQPQAEKKLYKPKQLKVFIEKAEPQTTRLFAYGQGEVVPKQEFELKLRIEGNIVYVADNFVNGGIITKGQVLLKVDPRDYELALIQKEADVAKAVQNLSQMEAQSRIAQQELTQLGRNNANDLAKWLPQLNHAQAMVKASQALLDKAKLDLSRTVIIAPFDGVVRNETVTAGQFIQKNATMAKLYATDIMEVNLPLGSKQLELLEIPLDYKASSFKDGVPVKLTAELGGKSMFWWGRIMRTNGSFDGRTRTLNLIAEVRNNVEDKQILPGLFVSAQIFGKVVENATTLERTSLRKNGEVWIVDDKSSLQIKPVKVEFRDSEKVIVTGVEKDEQIITSALAIPTPGMLVRALLPTEDGETPELANKKNKRKDKKSQPPQVQEGNPSSAPTESIIAPKPTETNTVQPIPAAVEAVPSNKGA